MKLEPANVIVGDKPPCLACAHFASQGIDAGERNELVLMFGCFFSYFFVAEAHLSVGPLAIDSEYHCHHIALPVVVGRLCNGGARHFLFEVSLHGRVERDGDFIGRIASGNRSVGVDINGNRLVQAGHLVSFKYEAEAGWPLFFDVDAIGRSEMYPRGSSSVFCCPDQGYNEYIVKEVNSMVMVYTGLACFHKW